MLVDYQCPQCGAPATIEETDRLFSCGFCRVKSFLLSRVYRYLLPCCNAGNRALVFFPYWRFKGIFFSCTRQGIGYRILDISHQAVQCDLFPASVGLRSQAMKLRFVSPATQGYFLTPTLPFKDVLDAIQNRYEQDLAPPVFHRDFIGDTLSLLYSPFYVDHGIVDAVLDSPICGELPLNFDLFALPGGDTDWTLRFIAAQCPTCGWDLDGDRDTLVLHCKNCDSAWQAGKAKFTPLPLVHVPAETDDEVAWLPFWRIQAQSQGVRLASYADFARLANLPRVIQTKWETQPFMFWSPAFKVRPRDFLRLSRRIILEQPRGDWPPTIPEGFLYPVTLPVTEAAGALKINLAAFMKPPGLLYPRLSEIQIKPEVSTLVYFPFQLKGHDLVNTALQIRINRQTLVFARSL
ncbi:MAG: hypothetical protein JRI36_09935 [Deltaproteobacteria bacterium]|nr:hypothetical protein [Deltaproteobacteria bacterium]